MNAAFMNSSEGELQEVFHGTNLTERDETPRMSIEKAISLNVLIVIVLIGLVSNLMILFAITSCKYFKSTVFHPFTFLKISFPNKDWFPWVYFRESFLALLLPRPVNYMIGNLMISSIAQIFGVFTFYLFKSGRINVAEDSWWICHILPVILRIPVPAEAFSILFLAVDRIRIAKHPLDKETTTSAKKKILTVWFAGILIEIPQAFFWKWRKGVTGTGRMEFQCYNTRSYDGSPVLWITYVGTYLTITYVLPSGVLLISLYNLMILLKFVRTTAKAARNTARSRTISESPVHSKLETLRNAALFILQFLITKLPPGTWRALYDLPTEYVPTSVHHALLRTKTVAMIFFSLNFVLNPLLIFIISRDIREYYWQIFACNLREIRSEGHQDPRN